MERNLELDPLRVNLMVAVILLTYSLIGMGIDLIAPSLPAIADKLAVSDHFSRNLIAIYFLGYGLGNFFVGVLSDAYGRRNFFLIGSCLFVLSSFLPVFFPKAALLLFARFLQGLTIGCTGIASRAILTDVLTKERIVQILPLVTMMWGLGPIMGPVIGGYLQFYFDWQACFVFFGLFGLMISLAVLFVIPETHFNRYPFKLSRLKQNFKEILSNKIFIGTSLIMGLVYSLLVVFNTLGPFLVQVSLKHSPVYFGHIAFILGVMFLLGTISCRKLIQGRILPEQILSIALPISLIIAFLSLILAYGEGRMIGVVIASTSCLFFTTGLIYPALSGKGAALFRHLAGNAGALMGLINILIVSAISSAVGWVNAKSMFPIVCVYFLLLSLASLSYYFLIREH